MKGEEIKAQHPVQTIVIGIAHARQVGDQDGQGTQFPVSDRQIPDISIQGIYFTATAAIELYPAGDLHLLKDLRRQAAVQDICFGPAIDDKL
jgi:hypothetical protein